MFLTNGGENAKFPNRAQHMDSDIRTSGRVAHVFDKFFFSAISRRETSFDDYAWHRDYNCNVSTIRVQ
jgi:hypothetical protein